MGCLNKQNKSRNQQQEFQENRQKKEDTKEYIIFGEREKKKKSWNSKTKDGD